MKRWLRSAALPAIAALLAASCSKVPSDPNVAPWRAHPGLVERFTTPTFRDGRTCWVYLPPGYAWSNERYPVLYITDGELAFTACLHLDRICEDLITRGAIRPILVVAIENGGQGRFVELTPWPWVLYTPNGGGDLFARAIRDSLKPVIDRRFRTLPDAANTAIGGESLGGLFAAYAGIAYDSTFGNVAAFSPAYWWNYDAIDTLARRLAWPGRIRRFYQDTGAPDDNDISGMEAVLLNQGFVPGVNFMSRTVPGARHICGAVEQRYPVMLRFLFGRR